MQEKGLDPVPFAAEGLGIKINLPAGAIVGAERAKADANLVITATDNATMPTWTLRIQSLTSTSEKATAAGQIDDLIREFKQTKQEHKVVSNQAISIGGMNAQLCYVQRTTKEGQPFASGWLVIPNGKKTFMSFTVQTLPEHLPKVRALLEASFATIQLRSTEEMASSRLARFEAGQHFLSTLTPQRLKTLIGQKQLYRIYVPADAKTGAAEVERGYSLVEVLEAKKGAVDPRRPEKDYRSGDKDVGLMVHVGARVVADAKRGIYDDSDALYWMAWDQSSETWSVTATRKQGDAEQGENETGVREVRTAGSPVPKLTVVKRSVESGEVPYSWEVPDGYLSQALGWLVGRLLPRDANQPLEYAYYFYVASYLNPKVYQRVDRWAPSSEDSTRWVLTTQLTTDSQPFTSIYGRDGALVRRTHSDGTVTEPVALEELRRIWKSKGLQTGKAGK